MKKSLFPAIIVRINIAKLRMKNVLKQKQGNKKIFKQKFFTQLAVFVAILISILSFSVTQSFAQSTPQASQNNQQSSSLLPLPGIQYYGNSVQDLGTGGTAEQRFGSLVVGLVLNARYLLTAIAIMMIVYAGLRMVLSQGNEDIYEKQKALLTWAIIGLALVGFAGDITRIFSVGECSQLQGLPGYNNVGCTPGGFLKDPNAIIRQTTLFNQRVQFIILFIKYLIGGVAVLMLMRNALRLVVNQASDEIEKDKKNIKWSLVGLFLIIISDTVINKIFFKLDTSRYPNVDGPQPAIDYGQGIKEIIGFTNYAVSILGPIAILAIVAGAIMYITSAGNEEIQTKAKRLITLALVGLLIIYGAFAIVSTFINGSFENTAKNTTNTQITSGQK